MAEEKKILGNFLQLGDGPPVDEEEVEAKVRMFQSLAKTLDGETLTMETAVAFAALKLLAEKHLGCQVDVGIRQITGKTREEVQDEIREEFERTGKMPRPADPSVH